MTHKRSNKGSQEIESLLSTISESPCTNSRPLCGHLQACLVLSRCAAFVDDVVLRPRFTAVATNAPARRNPPGIRIVSHLHKRLRRSHTLRNSSPRKYRRVAIVETNVFMWMKPRWYRGGTAHTRFCVGGTEAGSPHPCFCMRATEVGPRWGRPTNVFVKWGVYTPFGF